MYRFVENLCCDIGEVVSVQGEPLRYCIRLDDICRYVKMMSDWLQAQTCRCIGTFDMSMYNL